MSQLLIGTTLISLAPLVTEKTLLLLGRLAKQGRPIVFAAFILIIILIIIPPAFSQHSDELEPSLKKHIIGLWIYFAGNTF